MDERDAGSPAIELHAELGAAPRRVAYIDGLRGVAAIAVAWFHIYVNTLESTREWVGPESG